MKNAVDIFKALSNQTRMDILIWLKRPEVHFGSSILRFSENFFDGGICVGAIQEKAQLSQSTISQYLSVLQRAGLVESQRHGKWMYYRRNEQNIQALADFIRNEL